MEQDIEHIIVRDENGEIFKVASERIGSVHAFRHQEGAKVSYFNAEITAVTRDGSRTRCEFRRIE